MDNQPRHHQEEDPDELEAQHFAHVIRTFREYETYHVGLRDTRLPGCDSISVLPQLSANNKRRKDFHRLPKKNQELLEQVGWKQRLEDVDEKIAANQAFLDMIVDHPDIFSHEDADDDEHGKETYESRSSPYLTLVPFKSMSHVVVINTHMVAEAIQTTAVTPTLVTKATRTHTGNMEITATVTEEGQERRKTSLPTSTWTS